MDRTDEQQRVADALRGILGEDCYPYNLLCNQKKPFQLENPFQPERRTRVRKPPTLTRALREAKQAGEHVRGASLYGDHIELKLGEPDAATEGNDLDKWIAKHGAH